MAHHALIRWPKGRSGGLVFPSLEEFSTFIVNHTVKGFGIVKKAEIDVLVLTNDKLGFVCTSVDLGEDQQRQPCESIWKIVFIQTQAIMFLVMSWMYNQQ